MTEDHDTLGAFRIDFNKYVEADMAWKKRAEPVITTFENSSWAFKVFIGLLKILGLLAVAVTSIIYLKDIIHSK